MPITIELSDEQARDFQARADDEGVSLEAFVSALIVKRLNEMEIPDEGELQTEKAFDEAADYVLDKNAELYQRLS